MTTEALDHERGQFYLYSVLRLLPLRDADVRLTALPADSAGRPAFRAERAGWPTVEVPLGDDGRPVRLRSVVVDPGTGQTVRQGMVRIGSIEAQCARFDALFFAADDARLVHLHA